MVLSVTKNYGLISSIDQLEKFVDRLISAGKPVGFDIETGYDGPPKEAAALHPEDPCSKVVGFSFTNSTDWARYVPLSHDLGENLDPTECAVLLWRLLTQAQIVCHNAAFELRFLRTFFLRHLAGGATPPTSLGDHLGPGFDTIPVRYPELAREVIDANGYWPIYSDTMIEAYIAQHHPNYGLKFLTKTLYGHEQAELLDLFPGLAKNKSKTLRFNALTLTPDVVSYACEDALWCLALHGHFYPLVKDRFIYRTEMAVLPSTCAMEDAGAAFDWEWMERDAIRAKVFTDAYDAEIQADLSRLTGRPVLINLNSAPQLRTVLFASKEEGGLGLKSAKTTDTGLESTGAVAMEALSKKHPVVRKILDLKELKTLSTKFLDKYPKAYRYAADGRSHPSFLQANVISGRYACSSPNLQQSPREYETATPDEEKRKVTHFYKLNDDSYFAINFREYIVAPDDHYILGFDYSQIELRVLAGEAKEPYLIKAFEDGVDVHSATAALMFGIDVSEVTKQIRSKGKELNFSLLYQMGIKALADRLAVSREEAQRLYDLYFSSFVNIASWIERVVSEAYRDGYSQSRFGRIHQIWDFQSSEDWKRKNGERLAGNAPIQGSAADYTKIAMVRARKALIEAGLIDRVHIFLNVHDALEFYVHDSVKPREVIEVLSPAVTFPVPGWPSIQADWHIGRSLGTLRELKADDIPVALPPEPRHAPTSPALGFERGPDAPTELQDDLGVEDPEPVPEPVSGPVPEIVVPPDLSGWDESAAELRIEITAMPTGQQYKEFLAYVRSVPGPHDIRLVTPQGEIVLAGKDGNLTTGLTPNEQGRIALLLGTSTVSWTDGTLDVSELASDLAL